MTGIHTPSNTPATVHAPLDLTPFAVGIRCGPDGVWHQRGTEAVSYPAHANDACFALEDSSFWFAHRNACLLALLRLFPTAGPLFDIGGGNGFVAAAIQSLGVPVVVVEPGVDGIRHSRTRGLPNLVHATLNEAQFRDATLPAIGCFDVLEHIDDEQAFLRALHRCLTPGGRLYLTVPAGRWLWSDDDVQSGHFRRYTRASLRRALRHAGFRPLLVSKLFSPLPLPLFLCRSLPSCFGRRRLAAQSYSGLHQARGRSLMDRVWQWELARLARGHGLPCGTSCLAVAEKPCDV